MSKKKEKVIILSQYLIPPFATKNWGHVYLHVNLMFVPLTLLQLKT